MNIAPHAAIVRGDDYQFAIGWYWACKALVDRTIESVSLEDKGSGHFDDLVVKKQNGSMDFYNDCKPKKPIATLPQVLYYTYMEERCAEIQCYEPIATFRTALGNVGKRKRCDRHTRELSNGAKHKIGDRWENSYGYVLCRTTKGTVQEHRQVMEEKLNRKLAKGVESVHHINGIRNDNRPENLELWVGGIRYGQRAKDIKCHSCGVPYTL